ncbi:MULTISPECIES: PH domain-containing protein [Halorubrum]|uniref:PH domain-containing protein n=1 Tax=Halorubrum ruber TaxID=2982524 RepID=A0A8T8LJK0_9EURY|nr:MULTISPECIES: PH domain-containing protein [Halorubrum]QUO46994.1 PH domain-containing protein [Halorubrum ruber]
MTAQTLHPRVQVVWVLRAVLLSALVTAPFAGGAYLEYLPRWAPVAVGAVVLTLTVAHALLRYRRWSYEIREDAIYLDRGVITQVRTTVPLVRIQHVDSRRGPIERTVGLASCVVYTAGSRGADVRIPGLTPDGASDLREELKRLAIRADGEDAV